MILDKYDEIGAALGANVQSIPDSGRGENFGAGYRNATLVDSVMARRFAVEEVWGSTLLPSMRDAGISGYDPTSYFGAGGAVRGHGESMYRWYAQQLYDQALALERDNPGTFEPEILSLMTLEATEARAREISWEARDEFFDIHSRGEGKGFYRFAGSVAGGLYEMVHDPLQAVTILWGSGRHLLKFAAQQAIINGGIETMRQPQIAAYYEELGLDYTSEDFVRAVGLGAVGGAGFAVGLRVAPKGISAAYRAGEERIVGRDVSRFTRALDAAEPDVFRMLTLQQLREIPRVYQNAGVRLTPDAQTALNVFDSRQELENANPGLPASVHTKLVNDMEAVVASGKVPDVDLSQPRVLIDQAALDQNIADSLDGFIYKFDPNELLVDAKTFQFKEGGDEFGVTDAYRHVTEWDRSMSGTIAVYEFADGRRFIADGHQRMGMAQRIMARDPSQQISLYGILYREVDGVTPQEAMVRAAITNIAQGSGKVIDAAKIARMDPDRFQAMIGKTLSPTSAMVRDANGLMALGDDAWGAIINGVIKPEYGALIGQILSDKPELHMAAVDVLNKLDPANADQARLLLRQIREADVDVSVQENLFGDEVLFETLMRERMQILDKSIKQLKKDRAAFSSLVRNAETVEVEGNILDRSANQRRLEADAEAITRVEILANRKGPLSDALSEAARLYKDTGRTGAAIDQFVAAIRRSISDGDFDGIDSGAGGRAVEDPAPRPRSEIENEPVLEGFDEPTGHGPVVEQSVDDMTRDMFGAEPVAAPVAEPAPQMTLKQIEADLKARQPVKTVDDIYAIADESQGFIARIGAELEADLGVSFKNPGLKEIDAAKEKMVRKSYVSANQMTDISRAGFIAKTSADADAIAARFGRDAEILDEGWNVTPEGYFDRKILVRTPNGLLSEVQIWSPELIKAKDEVGHKLYKKQRASKDPEFQEEMRRQMRELYAAALKREDQSFRDMLGSSKLPKVPENADLNAASSGITRPVLETSGPSTGTQGPPGSRMATASEADIDMAGRPSQSTNITEVTPSGEQALIPGVEPITDIARAQAQMGQPMRGGEAAMPEGGLFDEVARAQQDLFADIDLDMEIPSGARLTGENVLEAETMTMRDVKRMLDEEDDFIERLGKCAL